MGVLVLAGVVLVLGIFRATPPVIALVIFCIVALCGIIFLYVTRRTD